MQDMATKLLDRGWNVLPMLPKSKKVALASWERFQTERVKRDGLLAWLAKNVGANIGVVTGAISDVVVVDIDVPEWKEIMAQLGLPETMTVKTAQGVHLYYKHPGVKVKTCRGIVAPHVDIRGDGGYVVGPTSTHPSGARYEVLSDVAELPVLPASIVEKLKDDAPKAEWREADNGEVEWVTKLMAEGACEGGVPSRHDALIRLACYFVSKRLPVDVVNRMLTEWNVRNRPPYDAAEVEKQVYDVYGRFQRGEYAPKATNEEGGGFNATSGQEIEAWTSDGMGDYLSALKLGGQHATIEMPFGFPSIDASTLGHHPGGVSVIGGYTNVGKTSFTLNTVTRLLEEDFKILVLSTEHTAQEILDRLFALNSQVPLKKFTTHTLTPEDVVKVSAHTAKAKNLVICDAFTPDIPFVDKTILKYAPDIVVFDHVQQAAASAASRWAEISAFARGFKGLMLKHKTAGILLSQLNDLPDGQTEPELKQVSESRVINQIADHVLLLWAPDNEINGDWVNIMVKIAKVKTGGKRGKFPFRFNITNNLFVENTDGLTEI